MERPHSYAIPSDKHEHIKTQVHKVKRSFPPALPLIMTFSTNFVSANLVQWTMGGAFRSCNCCRDGKRSQTNVITHKSWQRRIACNALQNAINQQQDGDREP